MTYLSTKCTVKNFKSKYQSQESVRGPKKWKVKEKENLKLSLTLSFPFPNPLTSFWVKSNFFSCLKCRRKNFLHVQDFLAIFLHFKSLLAEKKTKKKQKNKKIKENQLTHPSRYKWQILTSASVGFRWIYKKRREKEKG